MITVLIMVAVRSMAQVCGHSIAGITGLNPAEGMDVNLMCLLCVCVCVCVGSTLCKRLVSISELLFWVCVCVCARVCVCVYSFV
jgi:hypothetical protein